LAPKKPNKSERSILYVRGLPSGLLGRINGLAENLEMDRDEFVIELLRQDVERWEKTQQEMRDWWQSRKRSGTTGERTK
jgi:hypothetical protein